MPKAKAQTPKATNGGSKAISQDSKVIQKADKTVGQPKKPSTPFNMFSSQMHDQMAKMAKFKKLTAADRNKVINESWAKLTEDQKQQYVELADADKSRYNREMKKLGNKPEVASKASKKEDKSKPEAEVVKPKKTLTSYMAFASAQLRERTKEGMKITEICRESGQRWKAMTDE